MKNHKNKKVFQKKAMQEFRKVLHKAAFTEEDTENRINQMDQMNRKLSEVNSLIMKSTQQAKENDRIIIMQDRIKSTLTDEIIALQEYLNKMSAELKAKQDIVNTKKFNLDDVVKENIQLKINNDCLQKKLDDEIRAREKLHDTWKSTVGDLIKANDEKVNEYESKIKFLERQNEGFKASAKQATEVLEKQRLEMSKITALESELKLKNDQKQNLIQQKRDFEAKIRTLDAELKEAKTDASADECPICFEETSIERKWTAFLPCGHRTCSDCADKISALPRSTNRRKCPNCRENINCFLVLEGIYEG